MPETTADDRGFRALADAQRALGTLRSTQLPEGSVDYVITGEGPPNIVLLSGYGVPISGWALAVHRLAAIGTVFTYNRLGVGDSARPQRPQTAEAVVDVLRRTLGATGLEPPYVVVAHALGGLFGQFYARTHPEELAGLVLLESSHPDDDVLERHIRFLPRAMTRATLTRQARSDPNTELANLDRIRQELLAAGPFPDSPLAVVSGAKTPSRLVASRGQIDRHQRRQHELVSLSGHSERFLAPRSGYLPQITDPDTVLEAVRWVIAAS